ncbi:MAG: FAD-dependent oxidoreductase [Magnetospirillum sp.]|nr:FAD-dependent oxidoreductase [Magnetospirillum sp.]
MTPQPAGVVVVGSGLGGYTLARELRKRDPETPIAIVTADGGESYAKPMLSNAFAQGKDAAALPQKSAAQMAAELSATVLARHRVLGIDRAARSLALRTPDGGETTLPYGRLVLALGADPRPYVVEGSDSVTIHRVNDLDDYAAWRDGLAPGARILLIGAGLIGAEFANDLAGAGYHVTLVDPAPWPLGRLLPPELGNEMAAALAQAGITLHLGRSVARVSPGWAVLDDGTAVDFDRALSAIGLVPRTALAVAAGLAVDKGIVADRLLATSDPAIFALGDCAQTEAGPLPFVLPLMAQARALAATLAGIPTPLVLPALPVVVKTPALPLAVCPPPPGAAGSWTVEGEGRDRRALFVDGGGKAIGFALSGTRTAERQSLARTMPDVLAWVSARRGPHPQPGGQGLGVEGRPHLGVVVEEHEDVAASRRPLPHPRRPFLDDRRVVAAGIKLLRAVQAAIGEAGGLLEQARPFQRIGAYQGDTVDAQLVIETLVHEAGMADFHGMAQGRPDAGLAIGAPLHLAVMAARHLRRRPGIGGQQGEEAFHPLGLVAQAGRQLPQQRPQLGPQRQHAAGEEVRQRRRHPGQPQDVGDIARPLDGEDEAVGRVGRPGGEAGRTLQGIEGAVDLDGAKARRRVTQFVTLAQPCGKEHPRQGG